MEREWNGTERGANGTERGGNGADSGENGIEVAALASRLARLDMPFEGAALEQAAKLLEAAGLRPERLHDIQLMTIATEAYRTPRSPELV